MFNIQKGNKIIDQQYYKWLHRSNERHEKNKQRMRSIYKHVRRYWMVYLFLLTKIVAIAMFGVGIHFMVAYCNKVLPFGIVSENISLWTDWAYLGWFISAILIAGGIYLFFQLTINRWLEKL